MPAVEAGLATLTRAECRTLIAALRYEIDLVAAFHVEVPTIPDHLRHAVLPDATGRLQQELEAGILDAASKALNDLHNFPPVSLCRVARFFLSARPARDGLCLEIVPQALGRC